MSDLDLLCRALVSAFGRAPPAAWAARLAPVLALMSLVGCKREQPPPPTPVVAQTAPTSPKPKPQPRLGRAQIGFASWYGRAFAGKRTASGERFDPHDMTAAHRTLPLGSIARVTNTETGHFVHVEVNDRGPYAHGRILDLSRRAAARLGITDAGVARVKVQAVLVPAEGARGG